MHGKDVITLVNKNQPAGNHFVVWDGKDNSGNKIKPGVYFYQLKIENYSTVKKILFIK
jgi:flagellar hook assembly protein FlgD